MLTTAVMRLGTAARATMVGRAAAISSVRVRSGLFPIGINYGRVWTRVWCWYVYACLCTCLLYSNAVICHLQGKLSLHLLTRGYKVGYDFGRDKKNRGKGSMKETEGETKGGIAQREKE